MHPLNWVLQMNCLCSNSLHCLAAHVEGKRRYEYNCFIFFQQISIFWQVVNEEEVPQCPSLVLQQKIKLKLEVCWPGSSVGGINQGNRKCLGFVLVFFSLHFIMIHISDHSAEPKCVPRYWQDLFRQIFWVSRNWFPPSCWTLIHTTILVPVLGLP